MAHSDRCINEACARTFPRAVAYCPYCGTGQGTSQPVAATPAQPVAATSAQATAATSAQAVPAAPAPAVAAASAAVPAAAAASSRPVAAPPVHVPAAPPPPAAHAPAAAAAAGAAPAPAQPGARYRQPEAAAGVPRPPSPGAAAPARPPLRKPVGLGTWVVVALLLLAIWFLVKPKDARHALEGRDDDAVALTENCRIGEAREELAALRSVPATPAQLKRLQAAIASTAAACEKKELRAKAWNDARAAIEAALATGALERASGRLAAFVKRWGEDDGTKEWRGRIDGRRAEKLLDEANACLARKDRACMEAKLEAAEKLDRPEARPRIEALREALSRLLESTLLEQGGRGAAAAPVLSTVAATGAARAPAPPLTTASADADEARRLKAEAEHELAQGNFRAAMGRAAQCAALLPAECQPLRERAARLDRDFQACLKAGREWIGERCE